MNGMGHDAHRPEGPASRFPWILAGILLGGLVLRVGYVAVQAAHDPWFAHPAFDGACYLDWARAMAGRGPGPGGAFYLAPLYPWLLSRWIALFGESLGALYLAQQLLGLATAALIAIGGRRTLGETAALASAALFLLYAPLQFFASRPLGETVALFLLFAALSAAWRPGAAAGGAAGLLAGFAALARPNLLLVPLLWAAGDCAGRRWRRGLLLLGCAAAALLPVTLHNLRVSGHLVPVSSNSGLTFYHGNGPGARGVYTPVTGLSGEPSRQRDEATARARALSGLDLDAVEADRWWGRQALRARTEDPAGTAALLARRLLLTLDSHEYALDYAPELDTDPWRPVLRLGNGPRIPLLPLGLLLGLAAAGLILRGVRGSGGWTTWAAVAACALAPLLFYVSSRYRLPFAASLAVPAGCGLAALIRPRERLAPARWIAAVVAGALLCLASLLMPFQDLKRTMTGEALAARAVALRRAGDLGAARSDALRAAALAPRSAIVQFNAGSIAESAGALDQAETAYRRALALRPDLAEAAGNLAALLIRAGRPAEAIPPLRTALAERPSSEVCWNNLIVALLASGRGAEARAAADDARRNGVPPDPGLLEAIPAPAETPPPAGDTP